MLVDIYGLVLWRLTSFQKASKNDGFKWGYIFCFMMERKFLHFQNDTQATFERGDMYDAVYKAIKGGAVLPEANIFSLALCLLWYNMLGRIYA